MIPPWLRPRPLVVAATAIFVALGVSSAAAADQPDPPANAHQENAGSVCRQYPRPGTWVLNVWRTEGFCQRPANWDWEDDDLAYFNHMRWTGWGSRLAIGRGLFSFTLDGVTTDALATIRLSGRVRNCFIGASHYQRARMTIKSDLWRPRVKTIRLYGPFCDAG